MWLHNLSAALRVWNETSNIRCSFCYCCHMIFICRRASPTCCCQSTSRTFTSANSELPCYSIAIASTALSRQHGMFLMCLSLDDNARVGRHTCSSACSTALKAAVNRLEQQQRYIHIYQPNGAGLPTGGTPGLLLLLTSAAAAVLQWFRLGCV